MGHTVIWGRPERAAKGPAPSRSRAQIAVAAVALADAEGLEAVSMRRVATELGIGTASLYRYVERKDELYDLMVDLVVGEDGPPPPLTGDPRVDLTAAALALRDSVRRHPWLPTVAPGRPPYGPNSLVRAERNLAALDGLDLSVDEKFMTGDILEAFVYGFVLAELAEQRTLQRTGLTADEWIEALTPYAHTVLDGGDYPHLAEVIKRATIPHATPGEDKMFTAALTRILNGLLPVS